jgi:hypothetical protein
VVLAEQDAVSEEGEACAPVHLALDQLRFGVHSFCSSIVELLGESGVYGGAVELEAAGERVEVGQVLGSGLVDPAGQVFVVVGVGCEQCGEVTDEGSKPGSSRRRRWSRSRSTLAGGLGACPGG